tara:strand:- start:10017 stop:11942 length:1926 start_codon:yes stop_codon:yes gene_type:complete
MPFTKYANLDFDQIKTSIKDYLRANSDFTDFDFDGSNFSVLIDTLAYNTYITAFNSNMIVNESFLDSATLRENVVSLARNIGYVPRSRTAAKAQVSFDIIRPVGNSSVSVTLQRGLVCTGNVNNTGYIFSIPENITKTFIEASNGNFVASFNSIEIYEGTFLTNTFNYDGSLDQKFILKNAFIDTSTINVYIKKEDEDGLGIEYSVADNIVNVGSTSRIYLLQEVQDEQYQLLFGDGLIGKKLGTGTNDDGNLITANYIVTAGKEGNGVRNFAFSGRLESSDGSILNVGNVDITTVQESQNGSEIESIDSIKYFAPKIYSAQSRAVTARDYEAIIKNIYPDTDTVSVVGGEELDPPEYGTVSISIKPKNGTFVSDFNKSRILSQLKQYSISGINQKIVDLKILYVEMDSSVYYDSAKISTSESLKTRVIDSLTTYSNSIDLNAFGGRFKYSKVQQVIDNTDSAITSNISRIRIRRDLRALINQFGQYELCFGNKFYVKSDGYNIKSTGFNISTESDTVYLTDTPNENKKTGVISIVKPISNESVRVVVKSAGTIDYIKGEILLNTVNITSTDKPNNIIEIQAFPDSNDIIGLKDLYLNFSISKSSINMVKDVIASGDEISGVVFSRDYYTSSYLNGNLIRQ